MRVILEIFARPLIRMLAVTYLNCQRVILVVVFHVSSGVTIVDALNLSLEKTDTS